MAELNKTIPYSPEWKKALSKANADVFEEADVLLWDRFDPKVEMSAKTTDTQLVYTLLSDAGEDLAELRRSVFYTILTTPLVGIVYNIQTVITYHIPTWIFALASGSAALFRIGRLVEENRELLKRHYVVSKMLKNFELLPGFSLLTIGKNVDQISVLNGKIIEEYYKGRVSDTSVELLG